MAGAGRYAAGAWDELNLSGRNIVAKTVPAVVRPGILTAH